MKKVFAAFIALNMAGCATTERATNYFYDNVVDEHCLKTAAERQVLRGIANAGRKNKVYIICEDDVNSAFTGI